MSELREVLADIHGADVAAQLDNLIAEWPTWGWPKRTSSYELEAQGYALLQTRVRYSSIYQTFPRMDHNLLRRVHHAGRTGRFA